MAAGAVLGVGASGFAAADPPITTDSPITRDSPNSTDLYAADQFTYDDNLYRLPSYLAIPAAAGPLATRQDGFNAVSLGGDGRWFSDNQAIAVNLRADENRFIHNDSLNNISGKGNLEWDWRLQTLWSGQAGVTYYRGLANPANTGYFGRDVVEREDYFGNVHYQVGPHWAVYGGFIGAKTSQTALAEQLYDFHSNAGNAGVEFATSSQNTVTFDYRYTDATFPQVFVLNGLPFNSDYREDTARILVKYVFTPATELDVSAGYLRRNYPESMFATFSGDVWRAALTWQPTDQLQWVLSGWRQLTAYVDSESDYFVSKGVSVAPVWTVSETLTLTLSISREDHDYISSSPSDITFEERHDKLVTFQGRLVYAPTESLSFNLACRHDQRESNQQRFHFNDTFATAGLTYKIRP